MCIRDSLNQADKAVVRNKGCGGIDKMSYTFDGLNKAYYASVSSPLSSSLTWETVSTDVYKRQHLCIASSLEENSLERFASYLDVQ